ASGSNLARPLLAVSPCGRHTICMSKVVLLYNAVGQPAPQRRVPATEKSPAAHNSPQRGRSQMFSSRQGLCRPELAQLDDRPEAWHRRSFRFADDVLGLLDDLVAALEQFGYAKKDLFAVRLALEEALVNAVKHGNRGDTSKQAHLRYHVSPDFVLVEVED